MKDSRCGVLVPSAGIVLTIGIAMAVMLILVFLLSGTPLQTIYYLLIGPFTNSYSLGNMLNASIPLILTGLGVSFAFRSSMFNLGGEGQVYAGGLAATAAALALPAASGFFGIVIALLAAAVSGAAIAGLSGVFKIKWKTDELITSFLISNAVIHIIDYIITGPMADPANNLLSTKTLPESFWFVKIFEPSNLDISIVFAVLAAVLGYLYLFKTHRGYEMRICGLNPEFARYGGLNTKLYMLLPMLYSGALQALAGAVSVMGTTHSCIKGFSSGMGWNGIAVALIARNNPLGVLPAAVFFAYIEAGADSAMLNADITSELASVVKAVIFFFITSRVLYNIARRGRVL